MTIGTAIFLSALILGSVWLYVVTRGRWNWKFIAKLGIEVSKPRPLIVSAVPIIKSLP